MNEETMAGRFNVHSRAAVAPVPEVKDRDNDAEDPGATAADDTAKVDVAPKQLERKHVMKAAESRARVHGCPKRLMRMDRENPCIAVLKDS